MLVEVFPTLSMAEVHQVLACYWQNRAEMDAAWDETRRRIEAMRAAGPRLDAEGLRARWAARLGTRGERSSV